jgi:3-oxoacyl-ACP reductase-like protein
MKAWYTSKTVWVNSLTLFAGVIGYVAGQEIIGNNAELVAMLVALQGGVNVILRFFTVKQIS